MPGNEDLQEAVTQILESSRIVLERLLGESDAGVVIVGAAHLDNLVQRLLSRFLVDDANVVVQLLEPDQALGSFGAKITLAYLVGLLSKEEMWRLRLIKKIRNQLAHSFEARLCDGDLEDMCRSLVKHPVSQRLSARECFHYVCLGMAAVLIQRMFEFGLARCTLRAESEDGEPWRRLWGDLARNRGMPADG